MFEWKLVNIHRHQCGLARPISQFLEGDGKNTNRINNGAMHRLVGKILNKVDDILEKDKSCCIRCEATIEHNLKKPMCFNCFSEWKKDTKYDNVEKFCHHCETEAPTTIKVPICKECKEGFEKNYGDLSKHTMGLY